MVLDLEGEVLFWTRCVAGVATVVVRIQLESESSKLSVKLTWMFNKIAFRWCLILEQGFCASRLFAWMTVMSEAVSVRTW